MSKADRIAKAVKDLGLEDKIVFSFAELEQIMAKSNCEMFDVMYYLRYMR